MKWQTLDMGQYVEVLPLEDYKEHEAGDECWCVPSVERKTGSIPLISHNASEYRIRKAAQNWRQTSVSVNKWMLGQGFAWEDDRQHWEKYTDESGYIIVPQSAAEYFHRVTTAASPDSKPTRGQT